MSTLRQIESILYGYEYMASKEFEEAYEKACKIFNVFKSNNLHITFPEEYNNIFIYIKQVKRNYDNALEDKETEIFLNKFIEKIEDMKINSTFEELYQYFLENKGNLNAKSETLRCKIRKF